MKLKKIIEILESYAPIKFAHEDDNVGLQIGKINQNINKIIFTLDLTLENIKKIKTDKNTLIYIHHPLFFEPIKNINLESSKGQLINFLIKKEINVYSAHTNLDSAPLGINYYLGQKLGVDKYKKEILVPTYEENIYKISVFVPKNKTDIVRSAMAKAGAGRIGNYDYCSFVTEGDGTFLVSKNSSPFIGKKGILNKVKENKLEMIVGALDIKKVITAMKEAHPYEEVAYDIVQLKNESKIYGYGYVVELDKDIKVESLLKKVKAVRKGYKGKKTIKKLAYLSGSSKKVFNEAIDSKVDCLVIGEIDYHQDLIAKDEKMIVLEMGHYESENFIFKYMINNLRHEFGKDIMMEIINI